MKTELKLTDLMVGDYVMSFGVPHKVVGIRTDMLEPHIMTDMSDTWYEEGIENLLEPIPLTPEILEKNFELLYRKKGIYIYSGIKGRFIIQNHYNVKEWDWSLDYDKQTGTATAFGRVNYIHELQHCLRSNRIDKEIVV